jgi:hypothetical protein
MTPRCETIDALLLEGDLQSLKAAERHAETCEDCRANLATWDEISDTARSMKAEWRNEMLWPRIERALREERKSSPARAGARRRIWQVAAAVTLTAGLAGGTWVAQQNRAKRDFDQSILRISALDEVQKAEEAHHKAIAQLEAVAEQKLEDAQDPLMISYKEKLMLLDDAIANVEANIERNRQNAHLRRQLLAMYSEKQRTLRDVVQERPNVPNQ